MVFISFYTYRCLDTRLQSLSFSAAHPPLPWQQCTSSPWDDHKFRGVWTNQPCERVCDYHRVLYSKTDETEIVFTSRLQVGRLGKETSDVDLHQWSHFIRDHFQTEDENGHQVEWLLQSTRCFQPSEEACWRPDQHSNAFWDECWGKGWTHQEETATGSRTTADGRPTINYSTFTIIFKLFVAKTFIWSMLENNVWNRCLIDDLLD